MTDCTIAIWPAVCSNIWWGIPDKEDIICNFRIIRIILQVPDDIYERMGLKLIKPRTQFAVTWVNMVNKRMRSMLPLDVVLSDSVYLVDGGNFVLGNVYFDGRYGFDLSKYYPSLVLADNEEEPDPPYPTDLKSISSDCRVIERMKDASHRTYGGNRSMGDKEEIAYINQNDKPILLEHQQLDKECMFMLFSRIYRMCLWLGWDRRIAILQYTTEQIEEEKNRYFKQEEEFQEYLANYFDVKDNANLLDIAKKEILFAFTKHLYIYDTAL